MDIVILSFSLLVFAILSILALTGTVGKCRNVEKSLI